MCRFLFSFVVLQFRFKQFSLIHNPPVHAVGTDGVLLGAWVSISNTTTRILDVGTGCGLIAIMLAQRTQAYIDAIEILEAAYRLAQYNFRQCVWKDRLQIYHVSIQEYHSTHKYDLIVCNPPYFHQSLKPKDADRYITRHDSTLSFQDLITHSVRLLQEGGRLAVIVPYARAQEFVDEAIKHRLSLSRLTNVRGLPSTPPKRSLMEWRYLDNSHRNLQPNELTIETTRNVFTAEYRQLTGDFFIQF